MLEQHARPDVVRVTCQDCGQAVEGALVVEQRLIDLAEVHEHLEVRTAEGIGDLVFPARVLPALLLGVNRREARARDRPARMGLDRLLVGCLSVVQAT